MLHLQKNNILFTIFIRKQQVLLTTLAYKQQISFTSTRKQNTLTRGSDEPYRPPGLNKLNKEWLLLNTSLLLKF